MALMEYIPSFIVPVEMVWFCERFFFEVVIAMVKDKRIQYRRYNVNKNQFYALHEVDQSNDTVFEEFDIVYIFLLLFSFHYHCQPVKGQLQQMPGVLLPPAPSPPPFIGLNNLFWYKTTKIQYNGPLSWNEFSR